MAAKRFIALGMIFLVSAVCGAALQVLLWKSETLLVFVMPALVYVLLCLRWLPWRRPAGRAASIGFSSGIAIPIIIWAFKLY